MIITREDLYNKQFDYDTLKTNIYVVSLLDILKTQQINEELCVKYILNKDFQFLDEEINITLDVVKHYQPHLNFAIIQEYLLNITNKNMGKRIDSIEDFESYMNKH